MADRVGQRLGNYRLVRLLGQGGFAEVYLGEHVYIGTQAAIKVLTTQLAGEDIEQFRVEATTLAHLEHPHIVRVLEFGVEGTTPFLVMNYAPEGTLRSLHPKGSRLPLSTVVSYTKQVASALQYAHDQKLIHRDVKPENMLLGRQQEVLLSDFGIALVAQTSRQQLTQAPTGTVAYMAPEQILGKPNRASDQYSLGIVVYEWLSGTLPFQGSAFELYGQHLHMPPTPLREKVSGIPPAVEQVVLLTLAKDPKQRFASVQAFATALEQAGQVSPGEAVLSGQSPPSPDALTSLREMKQPKKLATSLSQSSLSTELSPPPSHTALLADALTVPSESPQTTELVAPPSQASLPKDVISEAAPTEAATRSPERSGGGERVPEVVEERSPEEEGLREAREAWAYKAEMERPGKAKEEQARRDVEEELRLAREEQARRAEKERLRLAEEERARTAREERLRKAEEKKAQKAREEQTRKAEEERLRQTEEEQVKKSKEEQAPKTEEPRKKSLSHKSVLSPEQATSVQPRAQQEGVDLHRPALEQVPKSPSPSWSRSIFALLSTVPLALLGGGLLGLLFSKSINTNSSVWWAVVLIGIFVVFPPVAGIMTAAISGITKSEDAATLGGVGGMVSGLVMGGVAYLILLVSNPAITSSLVNIIPSLCVFDLFWFGALSMGAAYQYSEIRNSRK